MRLGSNNITDIQDTDLVLLKRGTGMVQAAMSNYTDILTNPTGNTIALAANTGIAGADWTDMSTSLSYTATKDVRVILSFALRMFKGTADPVYLRLRQGTQVVPLSEVCIGRGMPNGGQVPISGMHCLDVKNGERVFLEGKGSFSLGTDVNGESYITAVEV